MISILAAAIAIANSGTFFQNQYIEKNQPCPTCSPRLAQERAVGKNLMIFISFSVPLESWKDLSEQLERTEGFFVLKGIPGNSFEEFSAKITSLKLAGVNAPIDIDPRSFETYEIQSVPTIVLEDGIHSDKVVGNIRLDAALREMAEKGETSDRAKKILKTLRGDA